MNEYQELNKEFQECGANMVEPFNSKVLKMVQELVDRNTPMKVVAHNGEHKGFCPNCHYKELPITIWRDKKTDEIKSIQNHFKFCPNCGQALERSEEE